MVREARATGADIRFFSAAGQDAAFRASYLGAAPISAGEGAAGEGAGVAASRGRYRLWLDGTELDVTAPFRGEYGAENVAAVAAAAHMLGVDASTIAQGLADARMPAQRFNQVQVGSWLLIDDTYNANPLSMRRMLEAAAEQAGSRSFVAVLGAMLELGAQAEAEHEELGRHLARLKPAAVIWKGSCAEDVRRGLDMAGYAGVWQPVADADDFAKVWRDLQSHGLEASASACGGVALFKGSRSNKLETLVSVLTNGREI